jgi:hypothetical protein
MTKTTGITVERMMVRLLLAAIATVPFPFQAFTKGSVYSQAAGMRIGS